MRAIILILILSVLLLAADLPPTYIVDDDYTAVRNDVLASMNAADVNLPACEAGLKGAQEDLKTAEKQIADLRLAVDKLTMQKTLLEAHVTSLETLLGRAPGVGDQFAVGWERVDGPLGLAVGWSLGTAQCLGLAWVFNQEGFRAP